MGREQRSRLHIPPGTHCYLCGGPILDREPWNRDHVPPQRFYGKSIRSQFNPNLDWLYTHTACNSAYKRDEEYFVTCLAGHADTLAGRAVFEDIRRGVAQGHGVGLLREVIAQFGRVALADGSRLFNYDGERIDRITWKLVRGLYFAELAQVLPHNVPRRLLNLSTRRDKDPADDYPLFVHVRGTGSMGRHGAVFDYKWLAIAGETIRAHALALLLWDRIIMLALFHDPTCACNQCHGASGVLRTE